MYKLIFPLMLLIVAGCADNSSGNYSGRLDSGQGIHVSFDEDDDSQAIVVEQDVAREAGVSGDAGRFGEGSSVELQGDSLALSKSFTFMAWIKTNKPNSGKQQIIGDSPDDKRSLISAIAKYSVALQDNKLSLNITKGLNSFNVSSGELPLVPGEWAHIAVVLENDVLTMYHNGQAVSIQTIISSLLARFGNRIGNNRTLSDSGESIESDQFHGNLDEVMLYNTAWPTDDILELVQRVLAPAVKTSPLVQQVNGLKATCNPVTTHSISTNVVPNEIIVSFDDEVPKGNIEGFVVDLGLSMSTIGSGYAHLLSFTPLDGENTLLNWIQFFEQLCIVKYAEPNYVYSIPTIPGIDFGKLPVDK